MGFRISAVKAWIDSDVTGISHAHKMACLNEDEMNHHAPKMDFWARDLKVEMMEGRLRFHDLSQPDGHSDIVQELSPGFSCFHS